MVIDVDGHPHAGYYAATSTLKYASLTGGTFSSVVVDTGVDTGRPPGIAVDSQRRPHLAYHDAADTVLRYAVWGAGGWVLEEVYRSPQLDLRSQSLALDALGQPLIVFTEGLDATRAALKAARRVDGHWRVETVEESSKPSGPIQVLIEPGGRVHLTYYGNTPSELRYARKSGSGWAVGGVHAVYSSSSAMPISLAPSGAVVVPFIDPIRALQLTTIR